MEFNVRNRNVNLRLVTGLKRKEKTKAEIILNWPPGTIAKSVIYELFQNVFIEKSVEVLITRNIVKPLQNLYVFKLYFNAKNIIESISCQGAKQLNKIT